MRNPRTAHRCSSSTGWSSARSSPGCRRSSPISARPTASSGSRCSSPPPGWSWHSRSPAGWSRGRGAAGPCPPRSCYGGGLPLAARPGRSVLALAVVLFAMGLSNGVLDVAINVMGVEVERRRARRMLSLHARRLLIRGMAGAGRRGAGGRRRPGPPSPTWPSWPPLVLAGGGLGRRGLPAPPPGRAEGRVRAPRPAAGAARGGGVLRAAGRGLGDRLERGVPERRAPAPPRALAAAGLTVFSLAMALGRLAGDRLAERFGARPGDPGRRRCWRRRGWAWGWRWPSPRPGSRASR